MEMNKNFKKTLAQSRIYTLFFCCCVLELNFGWTGRSRDLKERVQLVKPEAAVSQYGK